MKLVVIYDKLNTITDNNFKAEELLRTTNMSKEVEHFPPISKERNLVSLLSAKTVLVQPCNSKQEPIERCHTQMHRKFIVHPPIVKDSV